MLRKQYRYHNRLIDVLNKVSALSRTFGGLRDYFESKGLQTNVRTLFGIIHHPLNPITVTSVTKDFWPKVLEKEVDIICEQNGCYRKNTYRNWDKNFVEFDVCIRR